MFAGLYRRVGIPADPCHFREKNWHFRPDPSCSGRRATAWMGGALRQSVCVLVKLDEVVTDEQRRKDEKGFRRRDAINQGREIDPADAVLTVEQFFERDLLGSDEETVIRPLVL